MILSSTRKIITQIVIKTATIISVMLPEKKEFSWMEDMKTKKNLQISDHLVWKYFLLKLTRKESSTRAKITQKNYQVTLKCLIQQFNQIKTHRKEKKSMEITAEIAIKEGNLNIQVNYLHLHCHNQWQNKSKKSKTKEE